MTAKLSEIRDWIEIPLRRPGDLKRLGAALPKGLLLYGPNGVGKSKLVDAIVFETNCFAIYVKSELVSYEGKNEVKERV